MADELPWGYKYDGDQRYLKFQDNFNIWHNLTLPRFTVYKVTNGVATIKMLSKTLSEYYDKMEYKIEYNPNHLIKQLNNNNNNNQNDTQYIKGKLNSQTVYVPFIHFNIRFPIYVYRYIIKIKIYIKFIDIETKKLKRYPYNKYLKPREVTIKLRSSLVTPKFKVDDIVYFKYENNSGKKIKRIGTVHKILENNMYRVIYSRQNHKKNIHRDNMGFGTLELNVSINDYNSVFNNILFQNYALQKNKEVSAIFNALIDTYYDDYIINNESIDVIDKKLVSYFISINVLNYLYDDTVINMNKNNYKILCLMDNKHKPIKLDNGIRNYWYNSCIKKARRSLDKDDIIHPQYGYYLCDMCSLRQSHFSRMFHCNHNEMNHDFCLECINNIINQYNQLKSLLTQFLNHLNNDCIHVLVSFVVGNIVRV